MFRKLPLSRLFPAALLLIVLIFTAFQQSSRAQSSAKAVSFNGTQYITFGATGLGASTFTLELWFNRTGAGTATSTGTGGIASAIPLLTKGRGEAEATNVDMNYFLGIDSSTGKLVADFEEGATGSTPGLNHPVSGATVIQSNVWYHAAATYDGQTWRLYLNGVQDGILALSSPTPPRSDSIQHAGVATAMTSTGAAAGFFIGMVDEVRVWNVARTAAQILSAKNQEIASATGLIGRWGLNEGFDTTANNSVAGGPNGTLINGPGWVTGLDLIPTDSTPPAAPQNLSGAPGKSLTTLVWTANSENDLAGYNVYRSTSTPVSTSGTPLNGATPLTSPIFTDHTVTNGTTYYYAVTAVDTSASASSASAAAAVTPDVNAGAALRFNGSNQYVTFGQALPLGAAQFTIETWFKRTAAGIGTNTGSGGISDVIPLISKGRAENEGGTIDMNYILGIQASTGVLAADFEDTATGGNHPVTGATPIPVSTTAWHHAAATYDGTTWRLYLDGVLDKTLTAGSFTPRFDSIQHAAVGTAMNSTGVAAGFFAGIVEEARIWNYARTQAQIQSTMLQEVSSAAGLLGRWGLNEATGTLAATTAGSASGTLVNAPEWVAGRSFTADSVAPNPPINLTAVGGNNSVSLSWAANSESDLAGYSVYRSTSTPVSTASAPLNGATLVTTPAFTDQTALNGTTYYYVVTAADVFGNVSSPSTEASAIPGVPNQPPSVNAGPDQIIALPSHATLNGVVTDDSFPGSSLTIGWSLVSGPPNVTVLFSNQTAAVTSVAFPRDGAYTLRLTASDGLAPAVSDDVIVTVSDPVLVGAGDIVPDCTTGQSTADAAATATLLDGIPGTVFTLGDNAYQAGTAQQFAQCYDATWGRHKARTRPATGNHDYQSANGTPYFDYFNGVGNQNGPAGDRSGGYYSYDVGTWHVVVLNSECAASPSSPLGLWQQGGCAVGSPQEQWLRADLAAAATNNIIAIWHKPRFSSSASDATDAFTQPLWQALYEYGADIALGGHWHNYERLAPTDANGSRNDDYGIRQFIVGTGGVPMSAFGTVRSTSEVRSNTAHGVLKLTLHADSYDWQFVPIPGDTLTDSGTASAHAMPPQPVVNGLTPNIGAVAGGTSVSITGANFSTAAAGTTFTFGAASATAVNCSSTTTCTALTPSGAGVVDVVATANGRASATSANARFTFNAAPFVNAGNDVTVSYQDPVALAATVTDDGFGVPSGQLVLQWTKVSGPGTVTFQAPGSAMTNATLSQPGVYVLRLSASDGAATTFDDVTVTAALPSGSNAALAFNGTSQYVTFGPAAALGSTTFTIETWFKRNGAGTATSTGSGGVTAEPLVTKGRAEAESSNVDMNYFLGIDSATRVLVADFEDSASGANHPASGSTKILDDLWYHAAATFDGSNLRLYLNGTLEATVAVAATPRADSIQHAALGSALNSTGVAAGFFKGTIDEARIWNVARSTAQIAASMASEVTSGPNLIGRWGLNEGFGTSATGSTPVDGSLVNGPTWVDGTPFTHTPLPAGNYGIDLSGSAAAKDIVTFGAAPALGASTFTIETWFKRNGGGVATSTGSGGVVAIPLVTKGMAEADGSNVDMNYFLGIRESDGRLVADFEDSQTGANHPVAGTTVVSNNVWHHVAATFGNGTWTLYLDGVVDGTVTGLSAFTPRADSIQHAALGTALNSSGGVGTQTQGLFDGALDETRIWNYVRGASQIAEGMNRPLATASGLLGRWGFDSPCSNVADSSGNGNNGTLVGPSWTCVSGAPLPAASNQSPTVDAGSNQTITLPAGAALSGVVTDDGIGGPVTSVWSTVSGPGPVAFADPAATATSATFTTPGVYVLKLSAADAELSANDTLTVTVNPSGPVNQAPVVNAGSDTSVILPAAASLVGVVNDDGLPGSDVTSLWTKDSGPGTVTFADAESTSTAVTFSTAGTYVLRLTADDGALTASDTIAVTVVDGASANGALDLGGTNSYVTFGQAPTLGAATFTLELWFRRDGPGIGTDTGTSGLTAAVPLITKGRAQQDASNVDMNYFLGLNGNFLAADFEEGAGGATPGLNHPVTGAISINSGVWYHAAATYDGTKWRLYVNGQLDTESTVGQPPRADSIQHAAIGSALTSTGAASGFFDGIVDEVRIWNYARSQQQIQENLNLEIAGGPGLLGRWSFNEASGSLVVDNSGNTVSGTIVGTNFSRVPGATFTINRPPAQPTLNTPADGASGINGAAALSVGVTDPDADPTTVTFYGRAAQSGAAPTFTIVAIPDTQHYSDDPVRAATFTAQTQWIAANKAPLNIAFVTHLGDIVEHIDAVPEEWTRATTSLSILEANNFKWGLAPGNHDMNSAGVATNYDLTFPVSRFSANPWYGGHLGGDPQNDPINRENKDNYELFSVGGLDFLIIHLEYDMPGYSVTWADRILKQYPNRRAIISTHLFLNASGVRPTTVLNRPDGTPAETVWQQIIRTNCNVFLVLNGHYPGEANRTDLNACGQPVHQLASDYQSRVNGGDGWLRYLTFKPTENKIYVYTYSPTLNGAAGAFETDSNSQFVLDYGMQAAAYSPISTQSNIASGSTVSTAWSELNANTAYEWFVTVNDSHTTTTSPIWTFTTGTVNRAPVVTNPGAQASTEGANVSLQVVATDADGDTLSFTATGLPSGLTINPASGLITGTIAFGASPTNNVVISVTDGTTTPQVTFTWAVTRTNRAPIAEAQSVTTAEDAAKPIVVSGSDPDNDPLSYTIATGPAHGTLSGTAPSLAYTPAANYNGPDSFTFRVNDGALTSPTATVSITVTPVADSPVVSTPGNQTSAEGANISLPIVASDPDGETLTYSASNLPAGLTINPTTGLIGGSIAFAAAGTYQVQVTVTDPTLLSASTSFSWTVSDVSQAPVAVAQTISTPRNRAFTGTLVATDADNDPLTFSIVAQPKKGTVVLNAATGGFTYTPVNSPTGTDTFTFKANDGAADSNIATVTVKFTAAVTNTAPVATNGTLIVSEDNVGTGTLTATDSDGNALTLRILTNGTKGTVAITNAATGAYTYTPVANANGSDTFTFRANDGTADSNTATVAVTISPVNDPPVAAPDAVTTTVDTSVVIAVLSNDSDVDQDQLNVVLPPVIPNGTVVANADGTIRFTPSTGFIGQTTFTYQAQDTAGASSAPATVTVTVTGANQPATATPAAVTTAEDTLKAITLAGVDPEGATLTFGIATPPTHGTLTGTAPNITYVPTPNYYGDDVFFFTVNDGSGPSAPAAVTVTVTAVNDIPVALDATVTATRGVALQITLSASDIESLREAMDYEIVSTPKKGTLKPTSTKGVYNYLSSTGRGNDSFTFRVRDEAQAISNTAKVTIVVN
jgi:hypothetical protein